MSSEVEIEVRSGGEFAIGIRDRAGRDGMQPRGERTNETLRSADPQISAWLRPENRTVLAAGAPVQGKGKWKGR